MKRLVTAGLIVTAACTYPDRVIVRYARNAPTLSAATTITTMAVPPPSAVEISYISVPTGHWHGGAWQSDMNAAHCGDQVKEMARKMGANVIVPLSTIPSSSFCAGTAYLSDMVP